MTKAEALNQAMLAVIRDGTMLAGSKLKVLEALMEMKQLEESMEEAWQGYQKEEQA